MTDETWGPWLLTAEHTMPPDGTRMLADIRCFATGKKFGKYTGYIRDQIFVPDTLIAAELGCIFTTGVYRFKLPASKSFEKLKRIAENPAPIDTVEEALT